MNISGIRTYAGFYDYNSIKSQEAKTLQIQEIKDAEPKETVEQEEDRQDELLIREIPAKKEPDEGAVDYAKQYQPDFTYDLKGIDSDIANLDVEKALSDMKKDEILEQYQFFVGESGAREGSAENRVNEKFFL